MKNNIVINENHKNDVFASDKSQFHIRIRYPQVLYDGEKDKTNMLLFKKMNEYYSGVADAMYEKAKKCFNEKSKIKKDNFETSKAEMNYKVSLCDENFISIVLDISFEGKSGVRKKRFSQIWSVKNACLVPCWLILKNTYFSRKKMLLFVTEKAKKTADNQAFGYYSDYILRLKRAFSVNRFFITPKGVAFYVDAGILSDIKYGSFAFVVPFEKLMDFMKTPIKNMIFAEKNKTTRDKIGENGTK